MRQIQLGIIGGGTVGGGVFKALKANGALMTSRLGVGFRVRSIAVRETSKARRVKLPGRLLTSDWKQVVRDPKVDVVVELIGGVTTARQVVLEAFRQGKPVVMANKALLSAHGEELFAAARRHGVNLYYEASVAGGIPIIKVLREGLVGNRITRLYGIINGTCNYILSRMEKEGVDFDEVLADAQRLGFAEAEPSLDIDGHDAFHKVGILASLAHGFWVAPEKIHLEGIRGVTRLDMQFAGQLGYTIKLLGVVKTLPPKVAGRGNGPIQVAVYPALLPQSHVLAGIDGVFNAILARGDVVGDTLYYGAGAGQDATASAVLSDLADAALDLKFGSQDRVPAFVSHETNRSVLPMGEVVTQYYLRLSVIDRPGVLAKIAAIFGRLNIGISSVIQPEGHEGRSVPLIFMVHDASHAAMRRAVAAIHRLAAVKAPPVMFRVEDFD